MYFIGLDIGTSATKLLLMDEDGEVLNIRSRSYPISFPEPGWSEQDPILWWDAVRQGIPELLRGFDASQVAGIGACGQMHGLVVLDKDDEVIRPAILWNDSRTRYQVDYLNREVGRRTIASYTGNVAYAGFTAPKLLWMREEEPVNFSRIRKVMLPKDYVNFRLTGVHATDFSDASGTLLLDVRNRCWSRQMLSICGLRERQLPQLHQSWEPLGTLLPGVARELGLPEETLVCAGAGDNASAAVGTGAVGPGRCNIVMGTAGTILMTTDGCVVDEHNALHSFCSADGGWNLMGCILTAAGCNKWWMDDILGADSYDAEQALVAGGKLGQNDVYFLPYLMGERTPHNDPRARGAFVGLRMDTTRADMTQAVLEGVAFALRDCLQIARAEEVEVMASTICGGGATSPLWRAICADVLGIPLQIPQTPQAPAFGAAMLASVCCGAFPDVAECAHRLARVEEQTVFPNKEIIALYRGHYSTWHSMYPALKDIYRQML
ncbi:xylulokinase [Olsenella sp. oral taxon 809 str. F0356]|uniref:xylulokinase n=1 Tax=Olsenella sp. oral taxon 809 TaxID=661086 RepID=UPI000231F055|nr:xylulokinase [Olsenella sp. oral taxon 809]EHF02439.1 xylulokinase [Olsenella sp. oral taxon 809 str. F0356]